MNKIQISPGTFEKHNELIRINTIREMLEMFNKTSLTKSEYSRIFKISRPTLNKLIKNDTIKLTPEKKIIITAESLPIGKQSEEGRSRIQAQRE